jgi:hypothetical protein
MEGTIDSGPPRNTLPGDVAALMAKLGLACAVVTVRSKQNRAKATDHFLIKEPIPDGCGGGRTPLCCWSIKQSVGETGTGP